MKQIEIREEADILKIRSEAKEMAQEIGFGLVDQTRIATAVSELARNVFTYAGEGEVRIESDCRPRKGIKITFIDRGPGIEDVELALTDGYSTTRSMGKGLPGAKRLMDRMEIHTHSGKGTKVTVEKWLPE
ncbi:ATP-binding protein [candidate division WOR-3 bacterium]|uniref:ATP-binding protein n=1 Tax=candidate division WOR-3 bacterium TaxID=2052148 RepID=A0A9D5K9J1_UNCW3|nr:ATP-binding protein [candidate division WOR-3 bacterium]MBD3364640.1 ATP-binding protein [candidate division WOR-3 bacterium]